MSVHNAPPSFGGKKKTAAYYATVRTFIHTLRSTMTLAAIAVQLNRAGYQTPMDLPWCKQSVANVMRNA